MRQNTDPLASSRGTPLSPATLAVRAGIEHDSQHGAVVPPIHLSSTFSFAGLGEKRPYDYTRSGNPTRDLLAEALAAAEGGAGAVVTSSGMAAVHLALQLLAPSDLVVAPRDCYGGTYRLLDACAARGAFQVRYVETGDLEALTAALGACPRMVWVESPSNPLLRVTDIEEVCRLSHGAGALVVVDNTFLSPALQNPLALGADVVLHSTTKYLNGHSDVVGGAVVANDQELVERLGWWANCLGLTGAPFDSYLTLRGLRTLHTRMAVHEANARALSDLLDQHPAVLRVYDPGRPDHPGHTIAARQQRGFGAMLSFTVSGGLRGVRAFVDGLQCFSLAESLGGVESLVAHPATMTHAAMDPEARRRAGIGEDLLRLSVGIEAQADLAADLGAALDRVSAATAGPVAVAV